MDSYKINIIAVILMMYSCKKECAKTKNIPEYNFKGIYLEKSMNNCGHEIKIIEGFNFIKKLNFDPSADSSYYTNELPLNYFDTFYFNARKINEDELIMCNPLQIWGFKQIKIINLKKQL